MSFLLSKTYCSAVGSTLFTVAIADLASISKLKE
jgi:hypothetical protein